MARRPNRRRRTMPTAHRYERTDRVAQLVRSVVASEMERLDEAFEGTVITGVEVDRELSVAVVYYDVRDDDAAGSAAAAFDEHHHRLQRALGAGTSLRRTPTLRFRRDQGAVAAERIEDLLAGLSGEQREAGFAGLSGEQREAGFAGLSGEQRESELAGNAAERDEPGER